ncbi:hypothetical protein F5Y01DRAFT_329456 [Xylaria sp. FL0043]|nr:hypothetical protein F5Y01DRAFT_329456 [Xylaria sp. FL0043]
MPPLTQPPEGWRDDIWERHKLTLRQLYQAERKTLVDIKTIMERDYGFPTSSLSTYESKLRQMNLRKKMKKADWHAVYQKLQSRGGKESAVYLCGTKIPSTSAWKEIRRSGARSSRDVGQQKRLSRDVVVRTPSPGRQSPPLPLVFRNRENDSYRGIAISKGLSVATGQTTISPLPTRVNRPQNELFVLDLPSSSSDFHATLLQHTPSHVFKLKLQRIFEASWFSMRPMPRGDHLDFGIDSQVAGHYAISSSNSSLPCFPSRELTIAFHHISRFICALSNSQIQELDEDRFFDGIFTYFSADLIISLSESNSGSVQVFFEKALRYLFRHDRRNEFQIVIGALVRDHPDWLSPVVYECLFYASTMNSIHECQLLLDARIRKRRFDQRKIWGDHLRHLLKGEYLYYSPAIFSSIAAGYLDCARLLIEYVAQNCPLSRDCHEDSAPNSRQPTEHGVSNYNFEHPANQVTCLFFCAIFTITQGMFSFVWYIPGDAPSHNFPFRFEMDSVQQAFDIFIEYGLNVDALTPGWLKNELKADILNSGYASTWYHSEAYRAALLVSDIYVDLQTPFYLRPTVLDMTYNLNKTVFSYLIRHSKNAVTGFTRSGLYIAADRGGDHLSGYLDRLCFESAECLSLLELILFEQFILRFDLNLTYTLLKRGVGFRAFPQDLNLSLPLGRFVATIKKHGIKLEILEILRQILGQGAIIDADIMTIAIECQGTSLLELLSGYGADFATYGAPALFMAALLDNYEAVDWLLNAGVDINAGFRYNYNDNLITVVGAFFRKFDGYRSIWQRPASRYEVYFSIFAQESVFTEGPKVSMLKYLVGRGASLRPHPLNSQPNSLLLHAIMTGKHRSDILDIIAYILLAQNGFLPSSFSQPCLLEACFHNHLSCHHRDYESLIGCGLPIFEFLLASGFPIVNSGVLSLLIYYGAAAESIQMAIDAGVNVNTYSGRGHYKNSILQYTPLQAAAISGTLVLVKNLVQKGAEINLPARGGCGKTALQAACSRQYVSREGHRTKTEIIKFLIDSGADVNAPAAEIWGKTALQAAAGLGDFETAMELINHGADINAPCVKNRGCALDRAASHGRLDMTKFLLDLGALSANQGENGYVGAIEWAERMGHWAIAELIREYAMRSSQIRSSLEGSGF